MQKLDDITSPEELADIYTASAFIQSALVFIMEKAWLESNDGLTSKDNSHLKILDQLMNVGLVEGRFIKNWFDCYEDESIKQMIKKVSALESAVIEAIRAKTFMDQKVFLIKAFENMLVYYKSEEALKIAGEIGVRLYRAFDGLDLIFDLDYEQDVDMERDHGAIERLYQGSGVGVQSGYSTILLALDAIELKAGDCVVDLGSGYGRVGLASALVSPEITFIGYEYVPHRVAISNHASQQLGLSPRLSYYVQDLSREDFKIPKAQVYYLYDPFTKETYQHVLSQLVELSQSEKITIITKGNARKWLEQIGNEQKWPAPTVIDDGNLCIFYTS